MSNATMILVDTAPEVARITITEGNRHPDLQLLSAGVYQDAVMASTFKSEFQKGVMLQVGQRGRLVAKLEVASTSEQVVVLADEALTDIASAELGTVIDNRQVQFYGLGLFVPGVYPPVAGSVLCFRRGLNVAGPNEVPNLLTLNRQVSSRRCEMS